MITTHAKLLFILAGAGLAATASAQELMVFPNDGQDKEQQQQDEFTCFNWAKGETGFDPMVVPTATGPHYSDLYKTRRAAAVLGAICRMEFLTGIR